MAPDIALCSIVLPGRESRLRERPATRIDELVEPLADAVAAQADRPFAIFGHSLGAIVGYEVARRLPEPPLCLFASGRRAPHLPPRREPLHHLPDAQFVAALGRFNGTPAEVLEQRDLLELFLPGLRADFQLNDTYVPLPGPRLSCPVSAFVGRDDPETDRAELDGWRDTTTGEFRLRVFDGDHFYLNDLPTPLLRAIRDDLAASHPAMAAVGTTAR